MAQSGREIKRRIASIESTQQITKAMEMIAAAKLRRTQEAVLATRPYFERLGTSLSHALAAAERSGEDIPEIVKTRTGQRHCLVVLTADRGLAGGYNSAVIRHAEEFLKEYPDTQMVIVGRKARDHFRRRNQTFLAEYVNLGDDPNPRQAQDIGQVIYDFYVHDLFDRVTILYTKFINTVTHRVEFRQVLPIAERDPELAPQGRTSPQALYLYEPSVNEVLEVVVPLFIDAAIFQSLVEAKASELGARMTAMRNASDNAGELIKELNLSFNRARQAVITKEIAEIVGGADALES
ncbi:MAG: ATP synthase F1 subunit gamma [Firmicutes bacterium]|nr:ATP synthase F1 subunit gamma [Bacillota bacterium]